MGLRIKIDEQSSLKKNLFIIMYSTKNIHNALGNKKSHPPKEMAAVINFL